jgi:hypothetical protein
MTRITDLPGASLKFRANAGVGSFSKKLSSATRLGHLSHLSDNKDSIVKVLKKNEAAIRSGSFSATRRARAWNEIKRLEGSKLTSGDAKQIKKLLKHLSEGQASKDDDKPKIKIQKQLAKDQSFEEDRRKEAEEKGGKVKRQLDTSTGRLSRPGFANQEQDSQGFSFSDQLIERRLKNKEEVRINKRLERIQNAGLGSSQDISYGNQPVSRSGFTTPERKLTAASGGFATPDRMKKVDPGREKGLEPGRMQFKKNISGSFDAKGSGPASPSSPSSPSSLS